MLQAESPLGATDLGIGMSKVFLASDGNEYVVKFNYPKEHDRILPNELLGSFLAPYCGVRVPETKPIFVPADAIPKDWTHIVEGLHVAVRREDVFKAVEASPNRQPRIVIPFLKAFKDCDNRSEFGSLLAFDAWIANTDRASNPGNWLFVWRDKKMYLHAIDHGHAFGGPRSNRNLETIPATQIASGQLYKDLISACDISDNPNPFAEAVHRIEKLDEELLLDILSNLPEEWGVTIDERSRLSAFLAHRRDSLRSSINHIVSVENRFDNLRKEHMIWSA